jgi:membrane protease YdiL (CAAX protease family)
MREAGGEAEAPQPHTGGGDAGTPDAPPQVIRDGGHAHGPARARDERLAVPWTFLQTIIGVALTVLPLMALLVAEQVLPRGAARTLSPAEDRAGAIVVAVSSTLVEALFVIAPLYYAIHRRPAGASRWSGLRALGLRGFALGQTAALFLLGLVVIYGFGLLYDQLHIQTNADELQRQAARAPYSTLAALVVAVAVAPICEEIFFRGFVLTGLRRRLPVWGAIVVSALIFGMAHADAGSFAPLVVIGLVLAVVRWRSESLWPGIALHALNNAIAAVFILSAIHW